MAFSPLSTFDVRLPAASSASLALRVVIRDKRDCVTEQNLTSIVVQPDWTFLNDLLTSPTNSLPALLSAADQNTLGQVISSVSQQMNEQNGQQDVPVGETFVLMDVRCRTIRM